MNKVEVLRRDLSQDMSMGRHSPVSLQNSQASLSSVLRIIGPLDELSSELPPTRQSPPEDWSNLIEKVRTTASRVREVEANALEQEFRVRELLERVREDIRIATDRANAAETHARDTQLRTEVLLRAAAERVKAAEDRTQIAEGWLALIKKIFSEEFGGARTEKKFG